MEKTNTHYRSGVKRLLAFLLCAVCVFGMIPTQAFAFSPGQKASSWLGDQYVGSDGQHYYSPVPYTYLVYSRRSTAGNLALPSLCPALTRTIIRWRRRSSSGNTSSSFGVTLTTGTGTAMQTPASISA